MCEGDTVIVDVDAVMAMTEGVGIHWHGILQKDAQHMDGVPMITQCPITFGTFQYKLVKATTCGCFLFHYLTITAN